MGFLGVSRGEWMQFDLETLLRTYLREDPNPTGDSPRLNSAVFDSAGLPYAPAVRGHTKADPASKISLRL